MSKIVVFPGQGSQKVGMGAQLFDQFPSYVEKADHLLGYSIKDLCLNDSKGVLNQTEYTQPALFVVNALSYLAQKDNDTEPPTGFAGHSLGEYNALLAARVFDFDTGLQLVQRRGQLMSQERGGAMAAIVGVPVAKIREILRAAAAESVDIANYNTPLQTVISGPETDIDRLDSVFQDAGARRFVRLQVSGAFHSRYMEQAKTAFRTFLEQFNYQPPSHPVIANVSVAPYTADNVIDNLSSQLTGSVRWTDTIQHFIKDDEDVTFEEIGPGRVLTGLIRKIKSS